MEEHGDGYNYGTSWKPDQMKGRMTQANWQMTSGEKVGERWETPMETDTGPATWQGNEGQWTVNIDPGLSQGWMPTYGKPMSNWTQQPPLIYQHKGTGEPETTEWYMQGKGNPNQMGNRIWLPMEQQMVPKGGTQGVEDTNPRRWNWDEEPRWYTQNQVNMEAQDTARVQHQTMAAWQGQKTQSQDRIQVSPWHTEQGWKGNQPWKEDQRQSPTSEYHIGKNLGKK